MNKECRAWIYVIFIERDTQSQALRARFRRQRIKDEAMFGSWARFPWCADLTMAEVCCTVVSTTSAWKMKRLISADRSWRWPISFHQ
jgi:hypothetical protein